MENRLFDTKKGLMECQQICCTISPGVSCSFGEVLASQALRIIATDQRAKRSCFLSFLLLLVHYRTTSVDLG
jgi:hypothetical protein